MASKNGGPAFPTVYYYDDKPSGSDEGMSIRDYFAAQAPNPDPADICDLMGWDKDLPVGDPDDIGDDDWQDTMIARWHELPMSKRLAVSARHAYLWADAMIAARDK